MSDDSREGVGRAVSRSVARRPTARRTLYTHKRRLRAELQELAPPPLVLQSAPSGRDRIPPDLSPACSVAGPPRVTWEGGGRWRGDSVAPRVYFVVSGRRPAGRVIAGRGRASFKSGRRSVDDVSVAGQPT